MQRGKLPRLCKLPSVLPKTSRRLKSQQSPHPTSVYLSWSHSKQTNYLPHLHTRQTSYLFFFPRVRHYYGTTRDNAT